MAKAVLISIRPGWVEMILNGEKMLELRKTKPKLETPFKCYICCTKDEKDSDRLWVLREQIRKEYDGLTAVCAHLGAQPDLHSVGNGYVVGEFVCDRIESVWGSGYLKMPESAFTGSCLNMYQIDTYLDGKDGHFWHISDLKIYDKPKLISKFTPICRFHYEDHECLYREVRCDYQEIDYNPDGRVNVALCAKKMKRPPQSWCYVEELPDD